MSRSAKSRSDAERVVNARLRVVIADDERPARSFLAALLRSFEDVVLVAEAETGKEAVAAIERERPDLALWTCRCRSWMALVSSAC
jgi:DNA-binding NtrC family response regulator